jgi:hypothetical protein
MALVCRCFAAAALAQADDPPFWKQRGEISKDDAGRVIFAEERDPSTYTVRIFSKGRLDDAVLNGSCIQRLWASS